MTAREEMHPEVLDRVREIVPDWVRGGENRYSRAETERLQTALYPPFKDLVELQKGTVREALQYQVTQLQEMLTAQADLADALKRTRYADLRALAGLLNHLFRLLLSPMDGIYVGPGPGEGVESARVALGTAHGEIAAVLGVELEIDPQDGRGPETFATDEGGIVRLLEPAFLAFVGLPLSRAHRMADAVKEPPKEPRPTPTSEGTRRCNYVPPSIPNMEVARQVLGWFRRMGFELVPLHVLTSLVQGDGQSQPTPDDQATNQE